MKRYDVESGDACGGEYENCRAMMVESPNGDYVRYEELAAAEAKVAAFRRRFSQSRVVERTPC